LASVNIPVVMVGPDLRIRRFTAVAERLLNLISSDVGRPITDINLPMDLPDLSRLVGEVIDNLTTKETEVRWRDGQWWSVRIRPYRTTDNKIDGAIIAMVDIDAIKQGARLADQARALAEGIVNTAREPLVALDKDLAVIFANPAFYRVFHVAPEETLRRRLYDLGSGQWNTPALRRCLEEILSRETSVEDFRVDYDFPQIGPRQMRLNARRLLYNDEKGQMILLAIEDVTGKPGS
jgi:two-component system, chemotaxis family, CheB/CheR fusion protein